MQLACVFIMECAHLTAFPPDLYILSLLTVALSLMFEPAAGFGRSVKCSLLKHDPPWENRH